MPPRFITNQRYIKYIRVFRQHDWANKRKNFIRATNRQKRNLRKHMTFCILDHVEGHCIIHLRDCMLLEILHVPCIVCRDPKLCNKCWRLVVVVVFVKIFQLKIKNWYFFKVEVANTISCILHFVLFYRKLCYH